MAKQLTEQELRQQAVRVLSDSLGPVDALRFLALISREPFDYQEWRAGTVNGQEDMLTGKGEIQLFGTLLY
jgi:hypothetical protein